MALLHIFRVFLFFATLSVATVGLDVFTKQTSSLPNGGIGVTSASEVSSYDWISLGSNHAPEFSAPNVSVSLLISALFLWLVLSALPARPAYAKLHGPQQFSRPPPR